MPQFEPRLATTNTTPTPSGRPLTTTFIPLTDTTVSRSVVHPSSSVVSGAVIFSAPVGKHDDCESSDTSSSSDTESGSDREDALRKGEGISKSSPAQHRSTASGKAKKVCRASRTSQAASSSTTSLPPSQSLSSPQPRFPTQSPTPPTLPSTQSTATFFAGITPQSSQESSSTSVDHSATSTGVRSLWSAKSRRTRGTRTTLGSSTTSYPSPSTFYSSSATSSDLGASVPNLPTSPTPIPNPTQPSFVDLAEPGLDAGSAVAISLGVFAGSTLLVVATVVLMLLLLRRRKGCDNCGCRAGSESTAKRPSTSSESTGACSRASLPPTRLRLTSNVDIVVWDGAG